MEKTTDMEKPIEDPVQPAAPAAQHQGAPDDPAQDAAIALAAKFAAIEALPFKQCGIAARDYFLNRGQAIRQAKGGAGLEVICNGGLTSADVAFARRVAGPLAQAVCGYLPSSTELHVLGKVLDVDGPPPAAVSQGQADPPSDNRMVVRDGMTQLDVVDLLTGTNGLACYWGRRRLEARDQLLRELADELGKPAVAAGAKGFSYIWLRKTSGELVIIHRQQPAITG